MKKVFAIWMMAATLAACTREEQPRVDTPAPSESPATYTLTVKASKGTGTRALELVGSTLKATWDGSEKVSAQLNDGEEVAMAIDLGGQTGQAFCTLKGTFSQLPKTGDVLTLKLNGNDYTDQGGTLAFIGSNCDYALATLHVRDVTGGQIATEENAANFVNQQSFGRHRQGQRNRSGDRDRYRRGHLLHQRRRRPLCRHPRHQRGRRHYRYSRQQYLHLLENERELRHRRVL